MGQQEAIQEIERMARVAGQADAHNRVAAAAAAHSHAIGLLNNSVSLSRQFSVWARYEAVRTQTAAGECAGQGTIP